MAEEVILPANYQLAKIHNGNLFAISLYHFYIYDTTGLNPYTLLSVYEVDIKADVFWFESLLLEGDRAYISSQTSEEAAVLFIIDISDLANPVVLMPDPSVLASIPLLTILFAMSFTYIIALFKKKK